MPFFRFFGLLAILWLGLFGAWRTTPWLRPGAVIVTETKRAALPFPASVPPSKRVAVFGNSKVLTAFLPGDFDERTGTYSWNGGLPGETHFLQVAEHLIAAGQTPGAVLLTIVPSDAPGSDEVWLNMLFPFRRLPRDMFLFFAMSVARHSAESMYSEGVRTPFEIEHSRGYYFMKSHSRYPGDQLPDDLVLPSDLPSTVNDERTGFTASKEFLRWRELARQHRFTIYLAPRYYRMHEYAEPAERNGQTVRDLQAYPEVRVLGPDYFRFENRYFSDPVHLNPEGARLYSRKLAALFRGV